MGDPGLGTECWEGVLQYIIREDVIIDDLPLRLVSKTCHDECGRWQSKNGIPIICTFVARAPPDRLEHILSIKSYHETAMMHNIWYHAITRHRSLGLHMLLPDFDRVGIVRTMLRAGIPSDGNMWRYV